MDFRLKKVFFNHTEENFRKISILFFGKLFMECEHDLLNELLIEIIVSIVLSLTVTLLIYSHSFDGIFSSNN